MIMTTSNTKNLVLTALFIAVSFVGAHIRVFATIAFDSAPGFLAALLLGPLQGAVIGFLGHLLVALISGFPLSLPIHLTIALSMAITMVGFGYCYKALKNKVSEAAALIVTGIVGVILNGPVSLSMSMAMMALIAGPETALGLLGMLPILTLVAAFNIVIAIIIFKSLKRIGVNVDESMDKA